MQNAYIRMVLDVRERNTPNVIVVKKNDTARTLRIQLVDGNAAYTIGPECTVVMTAAKADGTKLFNSCTVEDNVVVYPFTEQTCSCAGRMICEVRVIGSDGKMLTSASFTMVVQETAYSDGDTVSQGEADVLSKLVAEAKTSVEEANNAVSGANAAAGKANAAAENADQAAENANTAAADVGEATQKANEAARLATEAAGQVGEAVRSANEAAQAANTAAGRVESAIAGANGAAQAAGSAAVEAGRAVQRADQAASHAGTSAQEASAAAQSAENAAQEAVQAAGKANEAGRDAATAATRANDAAAELQRRVEAGEFDGKTPVKGMDYWTEAEVQAAEDAVYQRVDGKVSPVVEQAKTAADQAAATANEAKDAAATADKKVEALREVVSKFHNNIVETARGERIVLDDASDSGLEGLRVFGRTEQNGIPTPDSPVPLVSPGDDGNIGVSETGKNLLKNTASTTITNGIEFVVNKDGSIEINGTATSQIPLKISQDIPYDSAVGRILNGCTGGGSETYSIMVSYYSNSGKWINEAYCTNGDRVISDMPNCKHVNFSILVRSGTAVNKKVIYPMLRDASISDPTYEPYNGGSITIPTPNGLPGIKVGSGGNYTDSTGQQWVCDEVDLERGVYVQRIGKINVFEADVQDWGAGPEGMWDFRIFMELYDTDVYIERRIPAMCNKFARTKALQPNQFSYSTTSNNGWGGQAILHFRVSDKIKTVSLFKEYVGKDCIALFKLKDEKCTPLSPDLIAAYRAMHTNYPNTNVLNDEGAEMEVAYIADTKRYIDKKFDQLAKAMLR